MRFSNVFLGLAMCGLAVASMAAGCGGDDSGSGGSGASGSSTSTTAAGGNAGFPCSPKASCTAGHECLSLTDNASEAKPGLRMSQLVITKPPALASGIVKTVVAGGVLPKIPSCSINGQGTFNWLMQFDKAAGKLKTGGAKPVADGAKGYSFVNEMVMGQQLAPVEVDVTIGSDGKFDVAMGTDLVVPIYLDAGAMQVVILPLKKARLFQGTLSSDGNCIGKYNAEGLKADNNCLGDDMNPTFINGAKLDGYITLEDADTVVVSQLSETLCVLLSGDAAQFGDGSSPTNKCKRTGGVIDYKGDWCDATNMAGGCQDSVQLGADFAASAVKINN